MNKERSPPPAKAGMRAGDVCSWNTERNFIGDPEEQKRADLALQTEQSGTRQYKKMPLFSPKGAKVTKIKEKTN